MKLKINIVVDGGRVTKNRSALANALKEFEGGVTVTLEKKKKTRSNDQNAYYWGVVIGMVRERLRELGNRVTIEDTHLMLRAKFLSEPIHLSDGEFVDHIKSTQSLSTIEFMDYILDIRQFCLDNLDIRIPEPNEQTTIAF